MPDLNHLFELQGRAHYAHARANTSAARLAGRVALADCAQALDAARVPLSAPGAIRA